ncbi:MAG: L-rhamnose mutarotase [Phycisphaerales bacterium]|nr:L-rhamnose mutarotase [Phycisphaerales bacterium]
MKSFAQALDLKDDPAVIEAYRAYHRNVYPEVLAALRANGITKMKIFLSGNRLFMYFEAPDDFDPARDFQKYTATQPRCAAWDSLMRTFQQRTPGARPGEWWAVMEEVFDLQTA